MIANFWKLIQPKARGRFIALGMVVLMGGLVELSGIAVVAEMMGLVASAGKTVAGGPLGRLLAFSGSVTPADRLRTGLVVALFVLAGVHGYSALRTYLRCQFVWLQEKEISSRLFSTTLQRPYAWFLTRNSAELHHLLLSGQVTQGLINSVLAVIGHISVAGTLIVALIWTDPAIALIGGLVVTIAYAIVRATTHTLIVVKGGEAHHADRQRRRVAQEALTSIRFVKTTGRERFFLNRFEIFSEAASRGMIYHAIYVDLIRAFLEWVSFAGILSLSVYLILQTDDFESLLPRLTLYTMASYRIVPAIHELFGLWTRLRFDSVHLRDIGELLNAPALGEAVVGKPVQGLDPKHPLLRFEEVEFRYPGGERQILDGVDLTVKHCEWIGVVGSTGAGKTTMLDIMSGLTAPTGGRVVVGTTTLNDEVAQDWQSHIGVVPQEVILLDDTLMRNVAFGSDPGTIDTARVAEVCSAAGLADLIASLELGYETPLGERGARLSGGERQRVGIARALYLRPDLLLLDEATSALDQATEARIVTTLRELSQSCTLVTVAHRLSSVRPCDRILVMDNGKIAAEGSYDELVRNSEIFQNLAMVGAK